MSHVQINIERPNRPVWSLHFRQNKACQPVSKDPNKPCFQDQVDKPLFPQICQVGPVKGGTSGCAALACGISQMYISNSLVCMCHAGQPACEMATDFLDSGNIVDCIDIICCWCYVCLYSGHISAFIRFDLSGRCS